MEDRKEASKELLICKDCGTAMDVTSGPDPYASEIHGDETPVPMCGECRESSAQDI